jgi:hypothetical protein
MNTYKVNINTVNVWISTDFLRFRTEKGIIEYPFMVSYFSFNEPYWFVGELVRKNGIPILSTNTTDAIRNTVEYLENRIG